MDFKMRASIIALMAIIQFGMTPRLLVAAPSIVVNVEPLQMEILERLPLVIRITILNTGNETGIIRFGKNNLDTLSDYSTLLLRIGQHTYRLNYVGGPHANIPMQPVDKRVGPGESITVERVVSLLNRKAPLPQWSGKASELNEFMQPGTYSAQFEIDLGLGAPTLSEEFQLEIRGATRHEFAARNRVQVQLVDFFEGRDRPLEVADYDGRRINGKVDVSRFGEIQSILNDFPNSEYAHWIRFWKFYHHGPVEEALEYARGNPEFPLSDNLMFHMAEGLFNKGDYTRSREVLAELTRLFPDGDTKLRADDLRDKLTHKP